MERLLVFAAVGLVAQLIDGALGMGYGATSATILLAAGITPASTASTVILAQVGTTFVSGLSHWRFGNVDWRVVWVIAIPGAIGGILGSYVLSRTPADIATPFVAGFLFLLGLYVLARFALGLSRTGAQHSNRFLRGIGTVAGFFNATGGGWGPIATPSLLANGSMAPRKVVGSVCTAEFVVVVATTAGYLVFTRNQYELALAGALLAGGVVAAPFAAYLVRYLHPRILGTLVGTIILLTNTRTGAKVLEVDGRPRTLAYLAVLALAGAGLTVAVRAVRRDRSPTAVDTAATVRAA